MRQRHVLSQCSEQHNSSREREEMLRCYRHYDDIQNCPEEDHHSCWIRVDCCQSDLIDFSGPLSGFAAKDPGFVRWCSTTMEAKRCNLPYMH